MLRYAHHDNLRIGSKCVMDGLIVPNRGRGVKTASLGIAQAVLRVAADRTGYGAIHHLTVPAYMLQHPSRYSREGWLEARRLLAAFLAGKAPAEVRRQSRVRLDRWQRPWRMSGGEGVSPPGAAV